MNHSFVPKNGGATIWEKNRGNPSLLFQQGCPCVKVMVFCSQKGFKGQVPFRNFHSPWRFWKKRNFHRELGDKGRLIWNILHHLAPNSFLSDEARRIGNPKLKEINFPTNLFSIKLLLCNASRPKSSKMKTMLQIIGDPWKVPCQMVHKTKTCNILHVFLWLTWFIANWASTSIFSSYSMLKGQNPKTV